jgi:methylmalonyl-CoA/ethylmalonyl-CoA epimerase
MILGIDHIGLATDDPGGAAVFLHALGLRRGDHGEAGAYGVACEFWGKRGAAPGAPAVELNAPVREDSVLTGLLARSGPGIYHLALAVDDLEHETARLLRHGFVAVDRGPRAGARPGMRVHFLYAPKPAGLLIELVEYAT